MMVFGSWACLQLPGWARRLAFVLLPPLLAACSGGGGGDAPNQAPTASFSVSVLGTSPGAMRFDASASADPDGELVGYGWDFGDGWAGQGRVVDHVFTASGSYTVTLVVTDNRGASASSSQPVDVTAAASLSGSVTVAAGMMVDADINDPAAPYADNDTPATAQVLANPVLLGGYVNNVFSGADGASFAAGDESDFFKLDLLAGQTVTLNIADHASGDLDLYLYRDDCSVDPLFPDDASLGVGKTELLTIPASGSYIVEVYALWGYSNYNLVVGQEVIGGAGPSLSLDSEFVPGEVIVRMKDPSPGASGRRLAAATPSTLGLETQAGRPGGPMLLSLGESVPQRQTALRSLGAAANPPRRSIGAQDQARQRKFETLLAIKALRRRTDVLYAEPNYIQRTLRTPLDAEYGKQWHYRMINLPSAWDVTSGSASVVVAVVDTGVLFNHPDLAGQFSSDGYDFIRDDNSANDDEPGIDANPSDPGDAPGEFSTSSFHGTHVAGTVAAATDFVTAAPGGAGVAPGARIMPLRVLGRGGMGTLYDINQALLYAAGLPNDSGTVPAQKADVINLSLGGGGYSQMTQEVLNQVRAAGGIVVAAAGNEASATPGYPASYEGVISVSAVDLNAAPAPYSNFGAYVDVAAPGGDTGRDLNGDGNPDGVLSSAGDDSGGGIVYNYKFYQGTSMATPHVAGVIALMKSVYGALTPAQVDNLLATGRMTRDLGAAGRDDRYGYGLIDAAKAVAEAQSLAGGGTLPPRLMVIPEALNLGFSDTSARLMLANGGGGDLSISSAGADEPWLALSEEAVDPVTGLGTYRITVDRGSLGVGTHRATLSFVSAANTLTVPVILQVSDGGPAGDAGYQYVLLIDSGTNRAVAGRAGRFENGVLAYSFSNVPFDSGQRYIVISGSDMDNDGFICDAGESCGAYLALDMPVEIGAGSELAGLDFSSGFEVPLALQSRSVVVPGLKRTR